MYDVLFTMLFVFFSFTVNSTTYKQYFLTSHKLAHIIKMLMMLSTRSLLKVGRKLFSKFVTYPTVLLPM